MEEPAKNPEQMVPVIDGIDTNLVSLLPRQALLDIIYRLLPTSTALKAIVLDKIQNSQLLSPEDLDVELEIQANKQAETRTTQPTKVEESIDDLLDDEDATDLESLSGDEASSHPSDTLRGNENDNDPDNEDDNDTDLQPGETGQLAGLGLSVLAKLIMEIMNSAPAPEGGMPWREFEGIWPPVMGTVESAVSECKAKGLLISVGGNEDYVMSTMPMDDTEFGGI